MNRITENNWLQKEHASSLNDGGPLTLFHVTYAFGKARVTDDRAGIDRNHASPLWRGNCLPRTDTTSERKIQQMKLAESEFAQLAKTHKTAEGHRKLAAHFTAHAIEHENDARLLEELSGHLSGHHDAVEGELDAEERHYAAHSREAAEAMRNLARIHDRLAKEHENKETH